MVEERLAACINILAPCTSIYRWEGAIEQSRRSPRTVQDHQRGQADALIARIAELHSYEVPAIVVWPIDRLSAPLRRLGRGKCPGNMIPVSKSPLLLDFLAPPQH